jgi:hypothetical protein
MDGTTSRVYGWNKFIERGVRYRTQQLWSPLMMGRYAFATLAIASACYVMPVAADEVGVGVGPVGVEVHGDRDRDKTVIEKRTPDRDKDKTVIINKDRDGDRDKTVIHHD